VAETLKPSFRFVLAAGVAACGVAMAGAFLLLTRGSFISGAIHAAIAWFALRRFWSATRRKRDLLRRGYFTGQRMGTQWVYEEWQDGQIQRIQFELEYAGRGGYGIHIPSEAAWRERMPAWAHERRDAIVDRLSTVFKRSEMHMDT
jgi:hypothetical protein